MMGNIKEHIKADEYRDTIKALRHCAFPSLGCNSCPYHFDTTVVTDDCADLLVIAADAIEVLLAEIMILRALK